ncbi:MAG: HK97 gp10 family phage protein [Selenomonadaceae bacterium]|nr:HK97 gp10 family phage protein [Selenomonadaceae bacterium]
MSQTLKVGELADAVMKEMEAYKDLSRDALESAITSSSNLIRDEIKKTAPVKTGTYAKS